MVEVAGAPPGRAARYRSLVANNDWQRWCEQFDALHAPVLGLYHSRRVWRTVRAMIETNPAIQRSGIAEQWMTQCYSVCQLAAVRRQVDVRKDVVSLRRSLESLARKPSMATRTWFVSNLSTLAMQHPGPAAVFDEFSPGGLPCVEKNLILADRDRLVADAESAKIVVDDSIAHQADFTAGASVPAMITWGELDTAIDTIGELYRKYYRLRHPGQVLGNLVPDLPTGWDLIFEAAWKPEGFIAPA